MTRGGEKIDRVEPELKRSASLSERSVHSRVKVMAAPLARVCSLSLDTIPLSFTITLRAAVTLTEANIENVLKPLRSKEPVLFTLCYSN